MHGGWSKHSYKQSNNAKSGVTFIIGKETRKLLFTGVRNKYCHACATEIAEKDHACFRNWSASSSEIKTDIGFWTLSGCYTQFIGDGDSSVYLYAIRKRQPCMQVLLGRLEKLVQDNPSYKGSGRLTLNEEEVSECSSVCRIRRKETDAKMALVQLRKHLLNGPTTALASTLTAVLIFAP